jgi:hypothetical protein
LQREEPAAVSGDYYEKPIAVSRMLQSKATQELNILTRSADFKSEVTWRLQLRPMET